EVVARILNEHFVSIKVDREERPDLDEVYMQAVQMLTDRGGWPMSVFLTPEGRPFFGVTYFPSHDRYGMIGFISLLDQIAQVWRDQPDQVRESGEALTEGISRDLLEQLESGLPTRELITRAVDDLRQRYDRAWGGFGGAP